MRVAYIVAGLSLYGKGHGIFTQAITWAEELNKNGIEVDLVNPWQEYDFSAYDILHLFSYCPRQELTLHSLKSRYGLKIAVSPIIDTNRNPLVSRLMSYLHFPRFRLYSPLGSLRKSVASVDGWLVRSEYEGEYLRRFLRVNDDKVFKAMLYSRLPALDSVAEAREDFCLMACILPDPRKNVMRVIQAAIKYNFKLVLAGARATTPGLYDEMMRIIASHPNIKVVGRVSDEELLSLYRRARVFALPSLMEGVGLVALEAAANGCDIVLTNRGGPKEYYDGMALLVDPLSIDQIGLAVMEFMQGKSFQPKLREYIAQNHMLSNSAVSLKNAYEQILD